MSKINRALEARDRVRQVADHPQARDAAYVELFRILATFDMSPTQVTVQTMAETDDATIRRAAEPEQIALILSSLFMAGVQPPNLSSPEMGLMAQRLLSGLRR